MAETNPSLTVAELVDFIEDAPHSTHHVTDLALPPEPHWRVDRWR